MSEKHTNYGSADYSQMTDEEFDVILRDLVSRMTAEEILAIGDVNMILREELNNDVLDKWAEENQTKAYPEEE